MTITIGHRRGPHHPDRTRRAALLAVLTSTCAFAFALKLWAWAHVRVGIER